MPNSSVLERIRIGDKKVIISALSNGIFKVEYYIKDKKVSERLFKNFINAKLKASSLLNE